MITHGGSHPATSVTSPANQMALTTPALSVGQQTSTHTSNEL